VNKERVGGRIKEEEEQVVKEGREVGGGGWGWEEGFSLQFLKILNSCRYKALAALQRHNTEHLKQIFQEKELRGLSPNCHIHLFVSNLYIPTTGLPILLQENMWTNPMNT
jgi:hypothetical protein